MSEEVNYKVKFAEKYFDVRYCEYDIKQVDIVLNNERNKPFLYIESKYEIKDENAHRKAKAQIVLTNKKQDRILDKLALIYKDSNGNDILELIRCDDSVMFNNDINWNAERASTPSKDAIDRINDRLKPKVIIKDGKKEKIPRIAIYKNHEIKEIYKSLLKGDTKIHITTDNANLVYNEWKNSIEFENPIRNEQELINLFLVDMLDGTKYKKDFIVDKYNVFGKKEGEVVKELEEDLIREGTNLNNYNYTYNKNGGIDSIKYIDKLKNKLEFYSIKNLQNYNDFWAKYVRPPTKEQFLKILEYSAKFYSDSYRRTTGAEYTPSCFVELQNEILKKHYNLDEFIVFDPCAGVGNLENDFGKDYKKFCYLSTLERIDVDTCKIKGFDNVVQFDYLKCLPTQRIYSTEKCEPQFLHNNKKRDIVEICKRENKKLMVIMNPPYQLKNKFKHDLAIEFFKKVVHLKPQVIVLYCKTEFFFRDSIQPFIDSGYKIVSHNFSNAKHTFGLSEWSVSQIIFDKDNGKPINRDKITAKRYEVDSKDLEIAKLHFVKKYTYNFTKPCLLNEIKYKIKENMKGMILGQYSELNSVLIVSNGGKNKPHKITTQNLKYCLMLKGLNINSHAKYFEWAYLVFRGKFDKISQELFNDALCFSLFYKGNLFSNKPENIPEGDVLPRNYIMPFHAHELGNGCTKGMLNVLEPDEAKYVDNVFHDNNEKPFDFRIFLKQFEFSKDAQNLFNAALEIFRFYHSNPEYENKDFNDSFYDITNAIMGKIPSDFKNIESNDTRITKVKTTKGTKGFGRNTIKYAINSKYLPIFDNFFEMRDALARKINKQLLDSNLLLWERENLY